MTQHKTHLKSYHSLGLQAPNRYESDLSNEVLYALVTSEAAKISDVKVGGRYEIADSARFKTDAPRPG